MGLLKIGWGTGFAVIFCIVLIAVIIYTVKKLRKQTKEAESQKRNAKEEFSAKEQNKANDPDADSKEDK